MMTPRQQQFAEARKKAEDHDRRVARYVELRLNTKLDKDACRRLTRFA